MALKSRMSSFVRLAPDGAPVALTTPDPAFVALDEAAAVRKKFSTERCEALVRASAAAFLAAVVSARRALMYAAMSFAGLSLPEPRGLRPEPRPPMYVDESPAKSRVGTSAIGLWEAGMKRRRYLPSRGIEIVSCVFAFPQ